MPSSHLILCHPLLLQPSIFPSIRAFSNESALRIRWPRYWSFSFSISPSNEYSRLILLRMDWLDLLAVQDSQESSPAQFKSISSLMLNLLNDPTGLLEKKEKKNIALTIQAFVGKVMLLRLNMLSRFVIVFLPRSKHLLIPWLHLLSSDFGSQENKICHCLQFFSFYLPHIWFHHFMGDRWGNSVRLYLGGL